MPEPMELTGKRVIQDCSHCGTAQPLPAIFCWRCGSPLIRISYWFVAFLLSFTAGAFGVYGFYAKNMWPIPIYLYNVFIFVCLSLIITRRYPWTSFRVILWSGVLLYAMTFLVLSTKNFFHNLSTDAIELMQDIRQTTWGVATVASCVALNLILGSVALTHRFKFTLAYRIFITFLILTCYAGAQLLEEPTIGEAKKMTAIAMWMPDTTVAEFLSLIGINLVRILLAEMVVYSLVTSFVPANKRFAEMARRVIKPPQYGARPEPVFVQAASQVVLALLRAGVYLQYFFLTLWKTLANYAWGMYRVLRRLSIDLITPIVSLAAVSLLLGILCEHIASYLTGEQATRLIFIPGIHQPLVMIGLAVLGLFACHMLFLAAVTKFRWADLWRCNALLALWLGPFFFAVFLFISLSLIATGSVLRHWGNDTFPYHFGPLTIVSAIVLLAMVGFAVMYRQRGGQRESTGLGVGKRLLLAAPVLTDEETRSAS